jgi:hypothetical protein
MAFKDAFGGMKVKPLTEAKIHDMIIAYLRSSWSEARFISSLTGEMQPNKSIRARNSRIQHSAGQPDLYIFEPVGKYVGLAIEIKRDSANPYTKSGKLKKNSHLEDQAGWLTYLEGRGWKAVFAVGLEQAREIIYKYKNSIYD